MYDKNMNEENVQGFNMSETVKVKKIKKVVKTDNTIDTKINTENETVVVGVDLGKSGDVGTCNGEVVNICKAEFVGMGTVKENFTTNPIAVKKVKKIVKTENIVKQNEIENEDYDSSSTLSDDELFEMLNSNNVSEDYSDKNESVSIEENVKNSNICIGKQIVFTKVTELDSKSYEDFTVEKYKHNLFSIIHRFTDCCFIRNHTLLHLFHSRQISAYRTTFLNFTTFKLVKITR